MATTLSNRVELVNAFYRLTGLSASDTGFSSNETSAKDTLYTWLYQAMREAQSWYLSSVDPTYWYTVSPTISWSSAPQTDGGYSASLPADFLRLFGDQDNSALRRPNGLRWGRLIDAHQRNRRGDYYYVIEKTLWRTRGSTPFSDLVADYNNEIAQLTDDTTAPDFPDVDRVVIPAWMAVLAADHPSFPGSTELRQRLGSNLEREKRQIYVRGRRTREPRKLRHAQTLGSHWFVTGN
ncbi:MAG: hypothetical protein KAJ55_00345 [Anaerolineales bacterium]|nr:hypothetical protein [Anaerolineales bacterium]